MSPSPALKTEPTHVVVRSAVDAWVAICLAAGPIIALVLGIVAFGSGRVADGWFLVGAAALTTVVTMALTCPCRYTLLADGLSIRCGLFHRLVPYDQIRSVEPSRSWASGLALSTRRLAIQTDRRVLLISPVDRESFQRQLRARLSG